MAGTLGSPSRRTRQNGGATCRLRLDGQLATDQLQTFLHAGHAESQTSIRRLDVEANTFIANGEIECAPRSEKMHIAVRCLAPQWTTSRLPERGWYLSLGGFDGS